MDIKNEYDYLIHLLKCYIHNEQPLELPDGFSFEKVFECGKLHEVGNIAYYSVNKLKNKPAPELMSLWKEYYYQAIQRHFNQQNVHQSILDAFEKNGIRSLELQGTVAMFLYPHPEDRMMSDIDIVIDKENIEKAKSILEDFGYFTKLNDDGSVNAHNNYQINLEIHHDFYEKDFQWSRCFGIPFDEHFTKSDRGLSYTADNETKFLYILAHSIRHYQKQCIGIRRVLDIYFLNKKMRDCVDKDYVDSVINNLGYGYDAKLLLCVADYWFDGEPFEFENVDLDEITGEIFFAGNHGNYQLETKRQLQIERENNVKFAKLRHYLFWVFPSKELLYSGYPIAKEKGWSPFRTWFYRLYKIATSKEKKEDSKRKISAIHKSDKK